MSLASLQISGVRSIASAALELRPGLNLVFGANGSGKTSILESAFLVGRGRSFRTRHTERLISRGQDRLQLFATTVDPAHRIGFEYRRDESYTSRLDGQDVRSLAELPGAFFVEVMDPEVHRLVEGAPGERRRWLDWGILAWNTRVPQELAAVHPHPEAAQCGFAAGDGSLGLGC